MTHNELWERIKLAIENPPCIIEWERRNGFAWWEDDIPYAIPSVAVAMVGYDLDKDFTDRSNRAKMLGWEWSYLMHFEMSLESLFEGDLLSYNRTGFFPFVEYKHSGLVIKENNYEKLEKLFI